MNPFRKLGEFLEAPNGRLDLKQPSGLLCVYTLCHCALFGIPISQPLCWALLVVGLAWYVGDVTQVGNVIKAAAGGFQTPEVVNQAEVVNSPITGNNPTVNQGPTQTPTTSQD